MQRVWCTARNAVDIYAARRRGMTCLPQVTSYCNLRSITSYRSHPAKHLLTLLLFIPAVAYPWFIVCIYHVWLYSAHLYDYFFLIYHDMLYTKYMNQCVNR